MLRRDLLKLRLRVAGGPHHVPLVHWLGRGLAAVAHLHAAMVLFYGDPDLIMPALLKREPLPPVSPEVTAVLFGPGLAGLCRPPSVDEAELWERLVAPVALADLVEEGYPREAMEAMLHSGAVEYGESPHDSIAHDL